MYEALLTALAAVLITAIALMWGSYARNQDHDRIRAFLMTRGQRLLEIQWAPLGRLDWSIGGAWGRDRGSWYRIRFVDREGNERSAVCRASTLYGLDFEDERVERYVDEPGQASGSQELENELLREESRRLERKPGSKNEEEATGERRGEE